MNTRRLLWTALAGVVLGIVGVIWDAVWHRRNAGGELSGATELIEAHWLMILGVVIIFAALSMSVRLVTQPRSAVASTWLAFLGSLSMVVGFAWDSTRHVQGTESPVAHVMIYAGLALVIVGIPAALTFSRKLSPDERY